MKHSLPMIKYLKLLAGVSVAIYLAEAMGLQNSYSAGIIALLSIQDSTKETLQTFGKRLFIFFAMTALSVLVLPYTGFHLPGFISVMVCYLAICLMLNMKEAIAPIAVLCTHYIILQDVSPAMILNEFLILIVGALCGIVLNLFFTENLNAIRRGQEQIEETMRETLLAFAVSVQSLEHRPSDTELFSKLDLLLESLEYESLQYQNNHFFKERDYFYEYLQMRRKQYYLLLRMYHDIQQLQMIPKQASLIADYFREIASVLHESNDAEILLRQLNYLEEYFDTEELPVRREEFENRAILFHILTDLRDFILLKQTFYGTHRNRITKLTPTKK